MGMSFASLVLLFPSPLGEQSHGRLRERMSNQPIEMSGVTKTVHDEAKRARLGRARLDIAQFDDGTKKVLQRIGPGHRVPQVSRGTRLNRDEIGALAKVEILSKAFGPGAGGEKAAKRLGFRAL